MSFIQYSYNGKYFTHVSEQINSAAPKDTNKENKTIKNVFKNLFLKINAGIINIKEQNKKIYKKMLSVKYAVINFLFHAVLFRIILNNLLLYTAAEA